MIEAVIFDMDGTVYDTEKIYARAWAHAGVSNEMYRTFMGTTPAFIKKVLREGGFDPDKTRQKRLDYAAAEIEKNGVPIKPGAVSCLKWLKEKGIKTAIGTSSAKALADSYLIKTDMTDLFDEVVSGQNLEHGKPAPDVFLYAAECLGVSPEKCVVVEDSYNGVRAGHAAGMCTVMIPDQVEPDEEMREKADYILKSLEELPELLEKF